MERTYGTAAGYMWNWRIASDGEALEYQTREGNQWTRLEGNELSQYHEMADRAEAVRNAA